MAKSRKCIVSGCLNYYEGKASVKSMFKFPKNVNCRAKWIDAINEASNSFYSVNTNSRVCQDRFSDECFTSTLKQTLRKDSTVFPTMVLSPIVNISAILSTSHLSLPLNCTTPTVELVSSIDNVSPIASSSILAGELVSSIDNVSPITSSLISAGELVSSIDIVSPIASSSISESMAESGLKVCRVCLEQLDENEQFHFLNNDNGSMLLSKWLDFLPEVDLDFVQNPISCNRCTIVINQIHEFKKLCVQTESVIKDLNMQQKSFDDVINHGKKNTKIKEELIKDKFENEQLFVDENYLQVNTDLPVCIEVPTKLLFYCYTCDYTTYNKKNLARHVNNHRLQDTQFKCNQCSYMTRNNFSLAAHKQSHFKISYVQKNSLKAHLRSHTREKQYKCNECDFRCSYKSYLEKHIRTHTGEKLYKCDICDSHFSCKSVLNKHILTHTLDKPYNCTACDYHSRSKENLTMHIRAHTGEKPYMCNVCDYHCNQKSNGEKQYKFEFFDYRCNQKSNLNLHANAHAGEKPYKCDVCSYSCNYKSN